MAIHMTVHVFIHLSISAGDCRTVMTNASDNATKVSLNSSKYNKVWLQKTNANGAYNQRSQTIPHVTTHTGIKCVVSTCWMCLMWGIGRCTWDGCVCLMWSIC